MIQCAIVPSFTAWAHARLTTPFEPLTSHGETRWLVMFSSCF